MAFHIHNNYTLSLPTATTTYNSSKTLFGFVLKPKSFALDKPKRLHLSLLAMGSSASSPDSTQGIITLYLSVHISIDFCTSYCDPVKNSIILLRYVFGFEIQIDRCSTRAFGLCDWINYELVARHFSPKIVRIGCRAAQNNLTNLLGLWMYEFIT